MLVTSIRELPRPIFSLSQNTIRKPPSRPSSPWYSCTEKSPIVLLTPRPDPLPPLRPFHPLDTLESLDSLTNPSAMGSEDVYIGGKKSKKDEHKSKSKHKSGHKHRRDRATMWFCCVSCPENPPCCYSIN